MYTYTYIVYSFVCCVPHSYIGMVQKTSHIRLKRISAFKCHVETATTKKPSHVFSERLNQNNIEFHLSICLRFYTRSFYLHSMCSCACMGIFIFVFIESFYIRQIDLFFFLLSFYFWCFCHISTVHGK